MRDQTRRRISALAAAIALAWTSFGAGPADGATSIDMTNPLYGSGSSPDTGTDIIATEGSIFTAGASYGGFAAARIDTSTGLLSPGYGAFSWGYGKVTNPTSSPVGWVVFYPYSTVGTPNASSMALHAGYLYLTGPAAQGASAGFGMVSVADGSVTNIRHISPRDSVPNLGLGATPGGDIVVAADRVYIFGPGAIGGYNDVAWVGRRHLDGSPDYAYGNPCAIYPPGLPCAGANTSFSILLTDHPAVGYGDTAVHSQIAYSVFLISSGGSAGRILVTTVDLDAGSLMEPLFEDGSGTSTYRPYAIAVQADGKLLIAGSEGTSYTSMFMTRYNDDGTPDAGFGTGGKVTLNLDPYQDDIRDLAIAADGTIIAVGSSGNSAFSARFLSDGTFDTGYSPTGYQLLTIPGRISRFNSVTFDGMTALAAGTTSNGTNPNLLVAELVAAP